MAGAWADVVSANFPVKKPKHKEDGHLQGVSGPLGVQLALEAGRPASCPRPLSKGHRGSILS